MIGATALCQVAEAAATREIPHLLRRLPHQRPAQEVLALDCVDIVLLNEGVYALHNLLQTDLQDRPGQGQGHRPQAATASPVLNPPERVVPQERMDVDLPGYAWDLLPYRQQAARPLPRPLLARGVQPQLSARPSPPSTPRWAASSSATSA